jgi:hypothetical protein
MIDVPFTITALKSAVPYSYLLLTNELYKLIILCTVFHEEFLLASRMEIFTVYVQLLAARAGNSLILGNEEWFKFNCNTDDCLGSFFY